VSAPSSRPTAEAEAVGVRDAPGSRPRIMDRPSVPKLEYQDDLSGAHWEFPERQPEKWPRERSIEHGTLTPVFGTAQPPTGLSGALRRLSYARYSQGRAAH
jgi:hypothetical protein